jgi:3-phosphoshikimate 1-carboxyvinyltransferase
VAGGDLSAIHLATEVPSAQVKGAVLLAGCAAEGRTVVEEAAGTRDHTERALAALGAPVEVADGRVSVEAFQHEGFSARVPGDISAAAFVLAAAALGGGSVEIPDVGLNPSRTRLLDVLRRMGLLLQVEVEGEALGEPIGTVRLEPPSRLGGTTVTADELPLLIDEVPALAMVAAFAAGETRFLGAGELRVKESDRLAAIASTIRSLGGEAAVEDDDLVLGGGGLEGGTARSYGDHRIAMAAFVAGVGARGPVVVRGIEAAEVSFPSFVRTMVALGAEVDG